MHLRPPSIDHGITSFIWAFVLGVLLWLFLLGVGITKADAFIVAAVGACASSCTCASTARTSRAAASSPG